MAYFATMTGHIDAQFKLADAMLALLREAHFSPILETSALYGAPFRRPSLLKLASTFEKIGEKLGLPVKAGSYLLSAIMFLVAAAIDRYVYVTVMRPFSEGIFLKYSQLENVGTVDEVRHPIIRESLRLQNLRYQKEYQILHLEHNRNDNQLLHSHTFLDQSLVY